MLKYNLFLYGITEFLAASIQCHMILFQYADVVLKEHVLSSSSSILMNWKLKRTALILCNIKSVSNIIKQYCHCW